MPLRVNGLPIHEYARHGHQARKAQDRRSAKCLGSNQHEPIPAEASAWGLTIIEAEFTKWGIRLNENTNMEKTT